MLVICRAGQPDPFRRRRVYTPISNVYNAVQNWLRSEAIRALCAKFGIIARQMEGTDNHGNVQFTGYYTPVVQCPPYAPRVSVSYLVCRRGRHRPARSDPRRRAER